MKILAILLNVGFVSRVNLNLSLRNKIPVLLPNLQNYYSHVIFQKIGKYIFKINVMVKTNRKIHELYYSATRRD